MVKFLNLSLPPPVALNSAQASEERVEAVGQLAEELVTARYHDGPGIQERYI